MNSSYNLPIYLFHQGKNFQSYKFFGCHLSDSGAYFRTWAPNASYISVVGDFNNWDSGANPMTRISDGGIWEVFVPQVKLWDNYKYHVVSPSGEVRLKTDPYSFHCETRPDTSSKVYDIEGYEWSDGEYIKSRDQKNIYEQPINIYEIHFGSWKRNEDGSFLSYRQMADELIPYVKGMGYTHIEVMPLSEYPFDGSWGYQVTGYFAATSRYGTPHDLMYFIDKCHSEGIGVILDWVPAHFPKDAHGLYEFDGTPCYEYSDPFKMEHKDWGTRVFDYSKNEVRSFLISSALFWLEKYHFDGLRVDAVASMLYLNYCREDGEWRENELGGVENLEAVSFLRELNSAVFENFSGSIMMIAEESSAWPLVTKPVSSGGLGFNFKWNMGWMNDILSYVSMDPLGRRYNHDKVTFSLMYAFSENFILPISHDEVVHGKASLLNKQPGFYEDKFSSIKAFLGYMMSHPGKKLLFMGQEFGQFIEWKFTEGLDWLLLGYDKHSALQRFTRDLNKFYLENPCLWEIDYSWNGFQWIDADDRDSSVLSYRRIDKKGNELIAIINFTPVMRENYVLGVPKAGEYELILNSDDEKYGGWGKKVKTKFVTEPLNAHGQEDAIRVDIPGLSTLFIKQTKVYKKPVKKSKKVNKSSKTQNNFSGGQNG